MGNDCHDGTCSTDKHGGCSGHCGCSETYEEMLLRLAHKAKKQLLLAKMQEEWEKRKGAQLSKKAAAAVDAMITAWEAKQSAKERHEKLLASLK